MAAAWARVCVSVVVAVAFALEPAFARARGAAERDEITRRSRSVARPNTTLASGPAAGTRREADAVCIAVEEMRMTLPPVSQHTMA